MWSLTWRRERKWLGPPLDPYVVGIVDGGLGAQGALLLEIPLDVTAFVLDVEAGPDAAGDDAGLKSAGRVSEVHDAVFGLVLRALRAHKLLKGKHLAIDTSVLEANASLRSLEHRLTGERYRQYVKRLAAEAGVDASDPRAVSTFNRKRKGRTTSHADGRTRTIRTRRWGRTRRGSPGCSTSRSTWWTWRPA